MPFSCNAAFLTLADETATDQLVDFYQQLLGQNPVVYTPGRYAEFHLPGLRLGIFHPRADHQSEFSAPSSGSMSLCLEVENLDMAIAHLTQIGYPPSGEIIHASHGREIYAADPAGNRLILHETS
jgi:predicted enzyme related to lactoylglutathione lyase